jgi:hypothetical protein
VRVADARGTLSLAVPATWAGTRIDSDWDPGVLGLPPGRRPALAVATDLTTWRSEYDGGPGVFAGTAAPGATLPTHPRCTQRTERPVVLGGLAGRVVRWAGCAGSAVTYSEALLGDTYVQIKQVGGDDRTDQVLRSLHS